MGHRGWHQFAKKNSAGDAEQNGCEQSFSSVSEHPFPVLNAVLSGLGDLDVIPASSKRIWRL